MRTTGLEFAAKGKLAVVDLGAPPTPGSTEVLIETRYTAITNGTERHAFLVEHGFGGNRFPSRHGYQHVGQIAAVGRDVGGLREGDWVFYGDYVGHRGWNLVSEDTELLATLPGDIDRQYAALFGVAGVALSGVRQMGVSVGHRVWAVGQGPIGNFTAQSALAAGARVTVTDIVPHRLAVAKACGAHVVLDARDESHLEELREGGPYDYIYDCCSAENLFFEIFEHQLLARHGTIGAMAVRDTATFPWSLLHGRRARIEVSCHFTRDDLRVLAQLCQQGSVRLRPLVTHAVGIEDAPRIYDMLASRSEDLLGVIFDWQ